MNMRNMIFALTTLVAFTTLGSSIGFAQDYNEVGVYTDAEMSDFNMVIGMYEQVDVFVVLSLPFDDGADVVEIGGVEFRFVLDSGIDLLTIWANPNHVDVGSPADGHCCGFGTPSPVVDGSVLICTKRVLNTTSDPSHAFLTPIAEGATIPGQMAYLNSDNPGAVSIMYPSSGSHDNPVFGFNTFVVATDDASIDQIKALYR